MIAHETAHIIRKDHIIKPLAFLLLAVYWFNPLVWVSYALLCRDIELACDERVIKDLSEDNRKEYAKSLLDCAVKRKSIAACPLAFGEVGVKTRIKGVMHYQKACVLGHSHHGCGNHRHFGVLSDEPEKGRNKSRLQRL